MTDRYRQKLTTAAEAVKCVRSGDKVYVGTFSSFAYELMDALYDRAEELEDVTLMCAMSITPCRMFDTDWNRWAEEHDRIGRLPFKVETFFLGTGERNAHRKHGMPLDFSSIHLSQIDIWSSKIGVPDVCFFQVSRPDADGNMSYSSSGVCDHKYFAMNCRREIVLEANSGSPYVYGEDNLISADEAWAIIETDDNAPVIPEDEPDEVSREVASNVVAEIPDGATIQLGIGKMGTAIGQGLMQRNDLGIFTEMFTTSMYRLIKNGNVTNRCKGYLDGKSVFAFSAGIQEMYDHMDYNPEYYAAPWPLVNDPVHIGMNRRMMSVNSAMAIDLFGQVAAEGIGFRQQSAVGGQMDYVKGAQMSEGGKSFIAINSSFMSKGERKSKIVLTFPPGTAITTPRNEVQYVATEYGCINLKNLNMADRVRAMISLAHPDFRDELTQQAKDLALIR